MRLAVIKSLSIISIFFAFCVISYAQDATREVNVAAGDTVEIVNRYGRVGVRAIAADGEKRVAGKLTAMSPKGVSDGEIKMSGAAGHVLITIAPADKGKRIDVVITLPEQTNLIVETTAGAVEFEGFFASATAKTDTGTIATDVPASDLSYYFLWTESHPRYLADFDVPAPKERAAGRFEIRGTHHEEGLSKKAKVKIDDPLREATPLPEETPQRAEPVSRSVELNFTTARGIILLNVPQNEVMSDLRERPLTEAAKAIVRSGDSLLMEAIRRAAPKYYGDYARSLPPFQKQPVFTAKATGPDTAVASVKTALVRVADLKNRAVPDLTAKDFDVTENGVPREIVSVEQSKAPFNLVLLLDVSGSVETYVNFIRKAARNFVNTVDEKDRISIIIFNDDVKVLSKFTTDKGKLSESLDTFDAGGGTAYYDALAYTISDTLRPLKGERTAIVILTDGDDNRSFLAFDSLLGSIQESGALIYPLYVPSELIALAATGADIDPMRKKYMSLTAKSEGEGERLAKVSGGVYYPITQIGQIQQAYEDIVLQLRSAYNITFKSEIGAGSGTSPRLKIKTRRENTFTTVNSVVAVPSN